MGFTSFAPITMRLAMVRAVRGGGQKGRYKERVKARLNRRECGLHGLVSRFMPAIVVVCFVRARLQWKIGSLLLLRF